MIVTPWVENGAGIRPETYRNVWSIYLTAHGLEDDVALLGARLPAFSAGIVFSKEMELLLYVTLAYL